MTLLLGLGLFVPTHIPAHSVTGYYVYQPFIDKKTKRIVDSLYANMEWNERLAQLYGITPGRLTDKTGKLSPQKCKEAIPYGIGHVCQFACALDNEPDKLRDFVADLQAWLKANTKTGIPAICHEEAIEGFAAKGATVFPQQIGMGCSWDVGLLQEKSKQTRIQMRKIGATLALSPMIDVIRTATFNRLEEGYGEDGYLTGCLGIGFVRGLQGQDMTKGVAACSKHFLGYGGGSELNDKELTEEILFPHEAIIRLANNKCIMTGYHSFEKTPVVASSKIIGDYLRNRTGFDGLTVSDYGAIGRVYRIGNQHERELMSGVMAMNAGNDLEFSNGKCYLWLKEAMQRGLVKEERVEEAVKRALALKVRLGMIGEAKLYENGHLTLDTDEARKVAYQAASESVVLLKNENILPLKESTKIALVGPNANSFWSLVGDYAYPSMMAFWHGKKQDGKNPNMVTLLDGMLNNKPASMSISYQRGCEWALPGEATIKSSGDVDPRTSRLTAMMIESADSTNWSAAIDLAKNSEVIIAAMGENPALCGEARLRKGIKLPGDQEKFVRELIATGKPVILIMFGGRPMIINNIADGCAAIMHAWYPGEEGGNAIADLLYGKTNPSGKLSISFPNTETEQPICYNYGTSQENLVSYPFGFGLSYTKYEYDNLNIGKKSVSTEDESIGFSFSVKNVGKKQGTEIVQVYLTPVDNNNLKPIQLKGFKRVTLRPNEAKIVQAKLYLDQLAYYKDKLWNISPGKYEIKVGAASNDIRVIGTFEVKGKIMTKKYRQRLLSDIQ